MTETGAAVAKADPHPQFPEYDADLMSESCMGIGVQYPQLWDVIKRYILRGDTFFQGGGLVTLAANAWSFPLDEAAEVLDEYYRKHGYWPPFGQTGRVSLHGLKAIHAVGMIPLTMGGEGVVKRQARMLALLDKVEDKARGVDATDVLIVQEVRRAMTSDRPWDRTDFNMAIEPAAPVLPPLREGRLTEGMAEDEMDRDEIVTLVRETVAQTAAPVSQMEVLTVKHGFEMLTQRMDMREKQLDGRLENLDKHIDRYLSGKQIEVGKQQVIWSRRAVFWGAAVALAIALTSAFLGALAQRAIGGAT